VLEQTSNPPHVSVRGGLRDERARISHRDGFASNAAEHMLCLLADEVGMLGAPVHEWDQTLGRFVRLSARPPDLR
jgi:hypothetical protein